MNEIKVLFCCMGNICRSPMAEGMFRQLVEEAGLSGSVLIDSAGTHAAFPDSPPDPRAQRAMAELGIDIGGQRARAVSRSDFEEFDLIVAMDGQNLDTLRFVCPKHQAHKLVRMLDYAPALKARSLPDPFHADESAFIRVRGMIEAAATGLLESVREALRNNETN
jgi:protein-tyrosine phosphatase